MRTTGANSSSEMSGGRERRSLSAMGRLAAPVVALVLLTILPPAAAVAQVRDPAVDQYVESVPGAGGGNGAPEGGAGGGLPSGVKRQIAKEGGADAEALAAVASSPALGAPKQADRPSARADSRTGPKSDPSALHAIASAAGGDGNSGGWLLAGIAALTAALAGAALVRKRSH
ncbi:MAG TPA: hypothetical protein VK486_15560 [Thermoleophilaceae bacterium]|nr:hypothetical protein [Thermoleophilaceae bacterium]